MPRAKLYVLDGRIINVGPWDEMPEPVVEARTRMVAVEGTEDQVIHAIDPGTGSPIIDHVATGEIIVRNPVPNGVQIIDDGEYLVTADERIVLPSEYAALRRAEYPPLTDFVDAVVKADTAQMDAYIAACVAVKAKYPKP